MRDRDNQESIEMEGVQNDWDALYHSQPDFDEQNIRNMADDGGLFQKSLENIAEQNLIESLLFREDHSGTS